MSGKRTHNGNSWTDARFRSFIVSILRAGTRRWGPKYDALKEAATEKKINKKTKRLAQHYKCNACKKDFPRTGVEVDHILPVVEGEFVDWNTYIERLFCEGENLQVLCVPCHKKKTLKEKHASKRSART